MAMDSVKCGKYMFGLSNILFLLLGLAIFVVGVYLKVSRSVYTELLDSKEFETATALCVSAGIIVIVVSLLGFWGLWMESQFVLGLFFMAVVIIFSLEIAAGVTAMVYRGKIEDILIDDLKTGLKDTKRRTAWNTVQEKFKCCGVHNFTDWHGVYNSLLPTAIPDSCCGYKGCGESGGSVAWRIGCFDDAKEWLQENYILLGAVCIGIGVLQITLMITSISLVCCIRRSKLYHYT